MATPRRSAASLERAAGLCPSSGNCGASAVRGAGSGHVLVADAPLE